MELNIEKIFEDKNYIDGFLKDSFREMLTVIMTEYFILFDNEYYTQHHENMMVSLQRPAFTNIFLCVHKTLWLEKYPPEPKPIIYRGKLMTRFCFSQIYIHEIKKFRNYLNHLAIC